MKLHLPLSLRSSLLAVVAASVVVPAMASTMHGDVSLVTYTDFGQNAGRYDVGVTNQLLRHIREEAGGVVISYTGGQADYVIPLAQGMIDFSSTFYHSTAAAISPSMIVTVGHNGEISSDFSSEVAGIGSEHAIQYTAVGDRYSSIYSNHAYNTNSVPDWRVTRESKIFTDITPAITCASNSETFNLAKSSLFYHAGSGTQSQSGSSWSVGGYNFTTGGIAKPTGVVNNPYSGGAYRGGVYVTHGYDSTSAGVNQENPLPYATNEGDSGSPVFVYDGTQYKLWGSVIGMNGSGGSIYNGYAEEYNRVIHKYDVAVDMAGAASENGIQTVWLHGVKRFVEGQWTGSIQLGDSEQEFCGLRCGLNTWADLSDLKDTQNWYTYSGRLLQGTEELFFTENLLFSTSAGQNRIVLNDTVDLGIGYAAFSGGKYTVVSAAGENNLFNHAGYVINEGAEVHLQLTNSADYMREWRKTGAGHLYIEGQGNNDVLLNLGGSGTVYLNREGGYAAYNVLANNGAKVVISGINQIKRDFTFGNGGGTLDMNGCSMDWYTTAETAESNRAGFSINALTEDALIANYSGSSTLTYREGGNTTFRGSFADSETSSLKVVYDVSGGTWTLNSIRTNLQHADSGLQVVNGRVILSGTNTVHGLGSDMPSSTGRYTHADDWHYADAAMNVAVGKDAVFELGSHARLTGDVTVQQGGTFVMREGVRHQMEYVEGGLNLEDTGKYSAYFGHKGDVHLNGGTFSVAFNAGVDSRLQYAGAVTGTGTMTVDTGAQGGSFAFSGTVDAGVNKVLNRGILELSGAAAEDTTNRWLVNAGGVMVQPAAAADTLALIDSASTGTLGLNADMGSMLDMSQHSGLYVGALAGETVQYGNAAELVTPSGNLNLGGAGGHLVVNSGFTGEFNLNLRAGTVTLTHAGNAFTATVNAQGGSTLLFADAAAAQNVYLTGGYGVRVNTQSVMAPGFQGSLLVQPGMGDISLADNPMVALGAEGDVAYSGNISLATGGAYRFGGLTGTLTVNSAIGGAHDLVVDNQGFEGGAVVLNNLSNLTGRVLVQGGDTSILPGTSGSVELKVVQNGTLDSASSVTLNQGATLELSGTSQILHGLSMAQGSRISDSSAEQTGRVTIQQNAGASLDLKGSIDADVYITGGHVITHGADALLRRVDGADSATLELQWSGEESITGGNYTNLSKLQVTSGSVTVGGKLDAATIQVNSGAQYATGSSHDSAFVLSGAGMAGATHQGALSLAGNVNMKGPVTLQSDSTINVVSGWSATISGAVDARNNTLTKSGEGTLTISGSLSNAGNIDVKAGKLALQSYNDGQNLVLTGGGELAVTNWGTRSDAVSIKDGSRLSLTVNGDLKSAISGNGQVCLGGVVNIYSRFSDGQTGPLSVELQGGTVSIYPYGINNSHTGGTILKVGNLFVYESNNLGRGEVYQQGGTIWLTYEDSHLEVDSVRGNGTIKAYYGGTPMLRLTGAYSDATHVATYTGSLMVGVQKSGAYTQEFVLNSDTTLPSVTVNGGTLGFRSDRALNLGSVNVASGSTLALGGSGSRTLGASTINGVLDLAGMNLANSHLDITAGATVTFGNNARLVLGEMEEGNVYTVFDTSAQGAVLRGWSAGNISIDSACAHNARFEFLSGGQVKYIGGEHYDDLVWSGGAEVELNADSSWKRDSDNSAQNYLQGDGVIFERNAYTLALSNDMNLAQVHLRDGASLLLNNAGKYTLNIDHISTDAASKLEVKGDAVFKGAGITDISGTVETEVFSVGKKTVNLLDGATVTTTRFVSGNTDNDQPSIVSIGEGARLIVTGDTDTDKTDTSFLLAHWRRSDASLVLNGGEISALRTSLHMGWDSAGRFEALAGEAYLKGILFSSTTNNADSFILDGATVNIGSGGISGFAADDTVELGNGTIAATADFSITARGGVMQMVGATVFDTNGYTITVDTGIEGSGKLNKEGAGNLRLNGSMEKYSGTMMVSAGSLVLGSDAMNMLTSGASLVVNEGGRLDLSAAGKSVELTNVSGEGAVVLQYNVEGNGTAFDFSSFGGVVELVQGRILLNESTFGDDCPDFLLTSSNSQLVFNGNGTVVNSNVHVSASTTDWHVNSGKSGTIGGDITGNSLVKHGGGSLTVGGNMKLDSMLSTLAGEVILTGAENSITNVDGAMQNGNTAGGTLHLAQDARLE
ncbi:MAG: hypothetical protein IIV41_08555, partial [Akkermansia sp.]|nr:hypothetical protein [Akkermansia sp.]